MPSKARQEAFGKYVHDLLGKLGLSSWTIRCVWDEYPDRAAEGNIQAEVEPTRARYLASLKLGEEFWDKGPREVRDIVVHELLHLEHASVWFLIDNDPLKEALGATAYAMLSHAMNRELELMVDHLTSTIAPLMPVPPKWPSP